MNTKPIKAGQHGIIDYVFSGLQLGLPHILGLNRQTKIVYTLLGSSFLVVNALTDTPVAVKPKISFKTHKKADAIFLTGLAALTLAGFIRKKPASRSFHLAILGSAVANFLLTDYDSRA